MGAVKVVEQLVERPEGQPGTVGRNHGAGASWTYPAVLTPTGQVLFWRDSETAASHWIVAPARLAESFEAGPEWQTDCQHQQGSPWRTCDSEADCAALRREDGEW